MSDKQRRTLDERFTDLADIISEGMGRWWVTALSLFALLVWLALGPFMHFSDSWQLIANTPTTWIELFIGFLIAAAANRVERRHDALLQEIKSHAGAAREGTNQDIETTERATMDIEALKADIADLMAAIKEMKEDRRDDMKRLQRMLAPKIELD